jgi:MarR family transcriptional regulator, organic hydroperoxide resistance regulator
MQKEQNTEAIAPHANEAEADRKVMPADAEIRDLNNRLFFRLLQVANVMHNAASQVVEPLGLTSYQWSVLGSMARFEEKGGASVNDLSAHLRMTRQNLSKILQRLEQLGLTKRVPLPTDLRHRHVVMTDQGKALWQSLQQIAGPFHENALSGFTILERLHFLELITRLERDLRK